MRDRRQRKKIEKAKGVKGRGESREIINRRNKCYFSFNYCNLNHSFIYNLKANTNVKNNVILRGH